MDLSQNDALAQHWLYGGRSILGGLTGAYLGALHGKDVTGYRERTGALFAPAVAAGMAIGRIGCLLAESPGAATGQAWGVVLNKTDAALMGSPANIPLHPWRAPATPCAGNRIHLYVNAFCPHCHDEAPEADLAEVRRLSDWLVVRDDRVWLERGCPRHGMVRTLYDESPEILTYLEQWTAHQVTRPRPQRQLPSGPGRLRARAPGDADPAHLHPARGLHRALEPALPHLLRAVFPGPAGNRPDRLARWSVGSGTLLGNGFAGYWKARRGAAACPPPGASCVTPGWC